jgi:hypothetical protein
VGEEDRVDQFLDDEPNVRVWLPLMERGLNKADCHKMLAEAGIEQAEMYRLGYHNNNCIGCVKATSPKYWNQVRETHPEIFQQRAARSRSRSTPSR